MIKKFKKNIILIGIAIFYSCSTNSEVNTVKDKEVDEDNNKDVHVVKGTYSDNDEPWLSLRKDNNSCSPEISRLKDGTLVKIINRLENSDYVEIEVIPQRGYVNKNYLATINDRHLDPKKELVAYSKDILSLLQKRNFTSIKKYIFQDSVKFFYWEVKACDLNTNFVLSLDVFHIDEYTESKQRITASSLINNLNSFNATKSEYKNKGYMPAAGFGGGSVVGVKWNTNEKNHIVTIPIFNGNEYDDLLWFEYKETKNGFSLEEVGLWKWSP